MNQKLNSGPAISPTVDHKPSVSREPAEAEAMSLSGLPTTTPPVNPTEQTMTTNLSTTCPATLLDQITTATVAAVMGNSARPNREALRALIAENCALIATGDTKQMAAALARQATALEVGVCGLLSVMSAATTPDQRLALAKAAAILHGAYLRSLSALRLINREDAHEATG